MNLQLKNAINKIKAISSIAFNILQLAAASIVIISISLMAIIFAVIYHNQSWIFLLIGFACGTIVELALIFYFSLMTSAPRWLLRGYRYVKTQSLYTIHDDNLAHHTFEITTEIEALKPGVLVFEDTYQWTGQGREEGPFVLSGGHTLMGEVIARSGWKYFYIHLGHELKVGDRTTVRTRQELFDLGNKFEPFLAKIISQPVDHLTLIVMLPKAYQLSSILFSEWNTVGPASKLIKTQEGRINHQNGEICWEIPSPNFGHRYEIRWQYQGIIITPYI